MATVFNRTTLERREGVPASSYDSSLWLIDPDLSAVAGVPDEYWKIVGDSIVEMTVAEKAAQDASFTLEARTVRVPIEPKAVNAGQLKFEIKFANVPTVDVVTPLLTAEGLAYQVNVLLTAPPTAIQRARVIEMTEVHVARDTAYPWPISQSPNGNLWQLKVTDLGVMNPITTPL